MPVVTRRAAALLLSGAAALPSAASAAEPLRIVCFIRYQIDPDQRDAFRAYAEGWGPIIPRLGGRLIGYFLPDEGTNDIGFGLIAFPSLAAYEAYRVRLKADPEARANVAAAQARRVVLREERSFLEIAAGTLGGGCAGPP